jgi:Zn-dependent M28 family amino/carboxypeptidase
MESDAERRAQPIPGANDGGSGTAVLLELANVLSSNSPPVGVDLLFVDGEDYGPGERDMYLGAKHFAATHPGYRPLYGLLLDMVGDRNPVFPIEGNSRDSAPEVVDRVWRVAEEIGHGAAFVRRDGGWITDDHIPLNQAGIRTIDIIDFDFAQWHTLSDDLDHVSARGLGIVGEVVTALIFRGG